MSVADTADLTGIPVWLWIVWTFALVLSAVAIGAYVILYLGYATWWNLNDRAGSQWGAGLTAILAISPLALASLGRLMGKRRGESGAALARRIALTSLIATLSLVALLVIGAAMTGV